MRAVHMVASAVLFVALLVAGMSRLFASGVLGDPVPLALHAVGLLLMTIPAIVHGALVQWWPLESRAQLTRLAVIIGAVQLVGAVVIVAVPAHVAQLENLSLLAGTAALSVGNVMVALAIRKHQAKRPPAAAPEKWGRAEIRSRWLNAAEWGVGTGLVTAALMLGLSLSLHERLADEWPSAVRFALVYGLLAFGVAAAIVAWPLTEALRQLAVTAPSRVPAIRRAVGRGSGPELSPELVPLARRYARISTVRFPFLMAIVLAYLTATLGIEAEQLSEPIRDTADVMAVVGVVGVVGTCVAVCGALAFQLRNARRYLAAHPLVPAAAGHLD
ncbi:hypothetical protein [Naasia aerilata]|uniref:Uncharacterized protein n=1 Tax=Naasia aerilata TaxID=1162966 RepID=A0ABN6XQ37_9MICO|nr:hypothetical protein [Naasia aerilata]BDZ47127.1 hypothetical protein GCM10025866_30360 [Naasia aerilata]